ncbi:MAG: hypothetical protein NC087_04995 [Anaeroplasma bactoclasticum]|nr:hypothetical protein [Anaeroplasma bactoclasticum]
MPLTPALSNNIALVKNYVDDPGNLYAVWRKGALTGDLETPFIQFIGARTMSYPVMPFKTAEMEDYNAKTGYSRVNAALVRREKTVNQDKGYQMGIDYLDLEDSHTTAVAYINNEVRQKDIPSIDKYRLNVLATDEHVTKTVVGAITKTNFFEKYDAAVSHFIDNEIPLNGTIMYVPTGTYNAAKNSEQVKRFIEMKDKNIDRNFEYLDSQTKIVIVPAARFPKNVEFILVQPAAVICGFKHSVTRLVAEPENFDGVLINHRVVHDCFVQEDRGKGVYVALTAEESTPANDKAEKAPAEGQNPAKEG